MGYFNGSNATSSGATQGKPGRDGIGFKLTANGNYDIQGLKLTNVSPGSNSSDVVVVQQINSKVDKVMTDDLDANFHEIKNVSRGSDNDAFPLFHGKQLFLTTDGNSFDAKSQKIINVATDSSVGSSAVNVNALNAAITSGGSNSGGDIDLQEKYNVLNSKQRTLSELQTHYDSLMSFEEVNRNFLSRVEEFPMQTQLNMNNNSITNLKTPTFEHEAATKAYADLQAFDGAMGGNKITGLGTPTSNTDAATKAYADSQAFDGDMGGNKIVNLGAPTTSTGAATKGYVDSNFLMLSGGTMIGNINAGGNKLTNLPAPKTNSEAATKSYVDEGNFLALGGTQNAFLYLMEDSDESSSESGITVYGINKFPSTPHKIFKKAYEFHMAKNAQNKYKSRIGFNFYRLPAGTYTFVVEFFPPTTQDVSIDCRSTSINVNHQIFKSFPGYWKNLVQLQKFKISPPEYLMVDIESQAFSASSPQGKGWMIVYGVEGTHSNVSSAVLDTPSIIDSGEQIMQVKLKMNMKDLFNVKNPIHDHDAATKKYVDEAGLNTILNSATSTYIDGYIKENAECLYSVEKALKTEVVFDGSERRVTTLFDQTLSLLNSNQTTQARQPALSTTKNAKRYFLTFDGSRRMISALDLNADIVNIFILFRLKTHSGSNPKFSQRFVWA